MIDTIALVMEADMFAILNPDAFQPSAKGLLQPFYYSLGSRGSFSCKLNPTRKEMLSGKYYPYITLTRRVVRGGFQLVLKAELSIPKFLWLNNFDEVTDNDFELLIDNLKARLAEKGILIRKTKLEDIPLSKVDFSKNIVLEKFNSIRLTLNELSKADMHFSLDSEEVKYRNAGYLLKFHNNSFELALYDKKKDMQKGKRSDKKSEENDNAIQLNLLEPLKKTKNFEVLRIEARLNSRQKIRQVFKKLGIQAQPTLRDVFNRDIAKKVLQYYWQKLEDGYKGLEYTPESTERLLSDLITNNPDERLSTILKALGTRLVIKEMGVRGFRNAISGYSDSSWSNARKTLDKVNVPETSWSPLKQINKALVEFKPVKLEKYKDKLYSNIN